MQLLESGEMYLETIYVLTKKSGAIRSLDIASYMNFSKPSVSRGVGLLKEGEYITVDKDGYITLTEKGYEKASKIYERHTLLTEVFISMGVDEETATEDACKMEHYMSEKTFNAIKKHFDK